MKVSIVTPSFNQASFIERTVLSVINQATDGFALEHMLVDGGSTDGTIGVLEQYDHAIRWVSEPDRGQADAVNKGIRATDGEIVGWLNSDDVYYPGAVARVVRFLGENPTVDVVYGMADHIDESDRPFETYPTEPWDFERLAQTCFISQPALFIRRRVVEQHGLLDDSLHYCMDYEYWLRLGKAGVEFAYLEEKLAGSRLYADNKTLGARVEVHREINDMLRRKFGKVPERWLLNYAHAVVEQGMSRADSPRLFDLRLMLVATRAALRWNRRFPVGFARALAQRGKALMVRG